MSAGPEVPAVERVGAAGAASLQLAASAVVVGRAQLGAGARLAQGAVVRSPGDSVTIGAGSMVLENCSVIGGPGLPTTIGRRTVFGHRCTVVGATVGDLCEIGNGTTLMPGSRLGDRIFLGEGTLVPAGMVLPDDAVAVGRPARIVRRASPDDIHRLTVLRDGDLSLPPPTSVAVGPLEESATMGQLYAFRGVVPTIAPSATVFATAEITGDVVIGERTVIGAGVKIIGDSHGPVRIGDDVQILENTVLHLLPDNSLLVGDGVVIGPGAMIHGCHIGAGSVVEPAAIVCDGSELGPGCIVRAGAVVKQRSRFPAGSDLDGFPAKPIGTVEQPIPAPPWALRPGDLPDLVPTRSN